MESGILLIFLFVVYTLLFVFLKSYIKVYLPLILLGYLIKAYNIANLESIGYVFIYTIGFLISFNMGKYINIQFFRYVPFNLFIYNLIEKVFIGFLFFLMLLIFVPLEITPPHFVFFISVISFVYSKLFLLNKNIINYYNINNIFIFFLLFFLYFFFKEPLNIDVLDKFFFIIFYSLFLLLFIKLKIESRLEVIGLLIVFVGLSIIFSFMSEVSILILGFLLSLIINFFSPTKRLIINSFIETKYKYFSVVISFFSGYFLQLSYNLLIVTVIYIILRTFLRGFYSYFIIGVHSFKELVFSSIPSLIQTEELLIFSIIYSLEFNFKESLSFVLGCVIINEFLLNYIHHYLKKQEIK